MKTTFALILFLMITSNAFAQAPLTHCDDGNPCTDDKLDANNKCWHSQIEGCQSLKTEVLQAVEEAITRSEEPDMPELMKKIFRLSKDEREIVRDWMIVRFACENPELIAKKGKVPTTQVCWKVGYTSNNTKSERIPTILFELGENKITSAKNEKIMMREMFKYSKPCGDLNDSSSRAWDLCTDRLEDLGWHSVPPYNWDKRMVIRKHKEHVDMAALAAAINNVQANL